MVVEPALIRHFTATGFVVHRGGIALHWHPKVKMWLPPGGHIEANEDPVQAVVREVLEETGLEVEVLDTGSGLGVGYPQEVTSPYTIMVEDIHDPVDGFHKHIDMIYFCRPVGKTVLPEGWQWVSGDSLESNSPLARVGSQPEPPPKDVKLLGIRAIEFVKSRRFPDSS